MKPRRPSPATAIALVALFFALGGSAIAARHYLISSTKQISPKVLKKLKGKTGKTGATGATGAPGAPGATGKEGGAGKEGASGVVQMVQLLPTGETNTSGESQFLGEPALLHFTDANTAAQVTGQVDLASNDGKFIEVELTVCYEAEGGTELKSVAQIFPEYTAGEVEYITASVSGIVGNLPSGNYLVGICTGYESENTLNGAGTGTVVLAQTRSGASFASHIHSAKSARTRQRQARH